MKAQQFLAFPDPHQEVPNLPAAISEILLKMVAKDPAERWESGQALADALAPYAESLPVTFDFRKILQDRAAEARRRLQRAQAASTASRNSSVSQRTATPSPLPASHASRETAVASGADTRPSRSAVTLTNPYASAGSTGNFQQLDLEGENASEGWTASTARPQWQLVPILKTPGEIVRLDRNRYTIGRGPECDIRIESQRVSQQHCQLILENQGWRIRNLSRNGTRINGNVLSDQLLWPGDRITLSEQFHFEVQLYQPPKKSQLGLWLGLAVAALLLTGLTAWWFWPRAPLPAADTPPVTAAPA